MTATTALVVTEPGIFYDMPEATYHGDPVPEGSLSSTQAKALLKAPRKAEYYRTHGRPGTAALDLGRAAHEKALGRGGGYVAIDGNRNATKVKDAIAEARAKGLTVITSKDSDQIDAMHEALQAHYVASGALGIGRPEVSLFWRHHTLPVWLRARIDWLRTNGDRAILLDYKTAQDASAEEIARAAGKYGWHVQAAMYLAGIAALTGDADAAFTHIVQEKDPPYLVHVINLDQVDLDRGHRLFERAVAIYAECRKADTWPGYHDTGITTIRLPEYQRRREERILAPDTQMDDFYDY